MVMKQVKINVKVDDEGYAEINIYVDKKLIANESIGGEPEDNSYFRDYSWVVPVLRTLATELGAEVEFNITEN